MPKQKKTVEPTGPFHVCLKNDSQNTFCGIEIKAWKNEPTFLKVFPNIVDEELNKRDAFCPFCGSYSRLLLHEGPYEPKEGLFYDNHFSELIQLLRTLWTMARTSKQLDGLYQDEFFEVAQRYFSLGKQRDLNWGNLSLGITVDRANAGMSDMSVMVKMWKEVCQEYKDSNQIVLSERRESDVRKLQNYVDYLKDEAKEAYAEYSHYYKLGDAMREKSAQEIELARSVFPDLDPQLAELILWQKTDFPLLRDKIELQKQLEAYKVKLDEIRAKVKQICSHPIYEHRYHGKCSVKPNFIDFDTENVLKINYIVVASKYRRILWTLKEFEEDFTKVELTQTKNGT